MKLVITRDIRNVAKLNLTPDSTQVHEFPQASPLNANKTPLHLHKGTRITIGTSEKQDELAPEEKDKILFLHHSKAIIPAGDKAVERIDREVKAEIAQYKADRAPKASMEEMIASAVASALVAAGVIKGKAAA